MTTFDTSTDAQETHGVAMSGWDVGQLSRALHTMPTLIHDPAFGQGLRYGLGEHAALTLDLFPPCGGRATGIVRLATIDLD